VIQAPLQPQDLPPGRIIGTGASLSEAIPSPSQKCTKDPSTDLFVSRGLSIDLV